MLFCPNLVLSFNFDENLRCEQKHVHGTCTHTLTHAHTHIYTYAYSLTYLYTLVYGPSIEMFCLCLFHRCLKQLGNNHGSLVSILVPEFLSTHPFFMGKEPDVDDPACILGEREGGRGRGREREREREGGGRGD